MAFNWNRFAYTNFHELNLDWFNEHFKEIFEEWEDLYNTLTQWKEDTDTDLDTWKNNTVSELENWENDLIDTLNDWKNETGADIDEWELETVAALNDWKTTTEAIFEEIRVQAANSATAAGNSATAAGNSATAAGNSATAAAASATSVSNAVNDINELKSAFLFVNSNQIKIDQGYWAIADGSATASTTWARTANYLNRDIDITLTTNRMYILAYDSTGTYVGTWDGTAFTTEFTPNAYTRHVVASEWIDAYPQYQFKLDFYNSGNAVTPTDIKNDMVLTNYIYKQTDKNSNNIEFLNDFALTSTLSGEGLFNPNDFDNGTLTSGEWFPSYKYRVSMPEIHSYPYPITFRVKSGFKVSVNLFTSGMYTGYAGWITDEYTIAANQQFKIMIARVSENTSEIADIPTFVSNIYMVTLYLKSNEIIEGNTVTALTTAKPFRYVYHFGMESVTERTITPPVIPSQSIYDVRNAKNLGFECIECNVHKTSDNQYVVTHGVNGKLGHDFDDLNGNDAGEQDIVIAQNTLSYLQTNFRYRSSNPNYRTPITTLTDFLTECAKVNISVMEMYCDAASLNLGRAIMGDHRIFFYGAPRSLYKGPIANWRRLTTKDEIIADCESYGVPYIYSMGNPGDFSAAQLMDIAQTLHSMGYQLMTAYRTDVEMANMASYGWDYFILGNNTFREPVIINGKQINFNIDGTVTWTAATI